MTSVSESSELDRAGAATGRTSADPSVRIPAQAAAGPSVRPGLLLALLLTGQFMALLDVAVVNVAMPAIRADLGASGASVQLVISGYTIAYAILLITGARLGERWGYSRLFQTGLALFTAFSLACGLAPSAGSLIAFRVVQGMGAALMVPQVMSLIQRSYVGAARVKALGAFTAVVASGMVVGQVLGGVLVSADLFGLGWRPVFLLNVPIGAVLLVAGWRMLPASRGTYRPLDLPGLLLLAAAVGLLVVPLVMGHEVGWASWTWLMLAGSALSVALFGLTEWRTTSSGGHPLIHGRVVRSPGLALSALTIFLVMTGVSGVMFALTLHLQSGLGDSPLQVGLRLAPMALGFGAAGLYWRRLPARIHPLLAPVSLPLVAAGYIVMAQAMSGGQQVPAWLEVVMFAMGATCGCAYGQVFASALSRVEVRDAADASGVIVTVLQLGQVVGVATIGTVFLSTLGTPLTVLGSAHAFEVAVLAVGGVTLAAGVVSALRPRAGQA